MTEQTILPPDKSPEFERDGFIYRVIDGVIYMKDESLARQLGVPIKVLRQKIKRKAELLQRHGSWSQTVTMIEAGKGAQIETMAYWLNQAHAIVLTFNNKSEQAIALQQHFTGIITAYGRGELVDIARRPAAALAPTEAEKRAGSTRPRNKVSDFINLMEEERSREGLPSFFTASGPAPTTKANTAMVSGPNGSGSQNGRPQASQSLVKVSVAVGAPPSSGDDEDEGPLLRALETLTQEVRGLRGDIRRTARTRH